MSTYATLLPTKVSICNAGVRISNFSASNKSSLIIGIYVHHNNAVGIYSDTFKSVIFESVKT